MKIIHTLIATALGAGFSPFAPGTAGAIVACIILWLIEQLKLFSTYSISYLLLIISCTTLGVISTNYLEKHWGKDPSKVVMDEVIGMWITMVFVPFSYLNVLMAFILFRFFDIAKPLGIRKLEKLPGGIGVMADDILAGIYANLVLQLIIVFI
ncbi:MAG: phosphatidylglycerophosphatase A [Flavobacteriales bacterium]|nr:phosphatidylglycerophosphatase A [Flavobacteriales bacterium]MCB9365205.1 phosphatidylglycerophosphatase A [Flavobacteriales bacterium]